MPEIVVSPMPAPNVIVFGAKPEMSFTSAPEPDGNTSSEPFSGTNAGDQLAALLKWTPSPAPVQTLERRLPPTESRTSAPFTT